MDEATIPVLRYWSPPAKLDEEQILKILLTVRERFGSRVPTESFAFMFTRAIERAHGIY